MKRLTFWLWSAAIVAILAISATIGQNVNAQGSGGAFVPGFPYVVTGQWTWQNAGANGLTPWIVRTSPTASAYNLTFTTPTANRTITFPNATGTVVLSSGTTNARMITGQADFGSTNPVSVVTGLTTLSACTASVVRGATGGNTAPYTITVIYTATAGQLDIWHWGTAGSASTAGTAAYFCVGA